MRARWNIARLLKQNRRRAREITILAPQKKISAPTRRASVGDALRRVDRPAGCTEVNTAVETHEDTVAYISKHVRLFLLTVLVCFS